MPPPAAPTACRWGDAAWAVGRGLMCTQKGCSVAADVQRNSTLCPSWLAQHPHAVTRLLTCCQLDHSRSALQWLERAREALKREVTDIQQQHVQLAAGLNSAVAVAAAAPASPQKQLAAQVGEKRWWAAGWLVGETRSSMQPLHFFSGWHCCLWPYLQLAPPACPTIPSHK